ncbi:MAG TPA: hypothetical protein VJX70_06890 [Candidatus Acidoferrum sp.]|nr:hypothetical protein [Candidatus Acidoferrum sp.]
MTDWQEFVRQRLSGLALDAGEKEEILAELTAHLEESYEAFCKEGLPQREAVQRTLVQVADWQDLQREILISRRREQPMKKRLHQLWIPGFLTLMISTIFLMGLQMLGFQPSIVGNGQITVLFYAPWLASLPFVGALGAYLSVRGGGLRGTVLLASVFPVLALTAAFLLMFPIGFLIERVIGSPVDFGIVATAILRDGIGWILVPGVALSAGGFLVHLLFSRRSWSKELAIG